MKVNLNKPLINLDGIEDKANIGQSLAYYLYHQSEGDPIKVDGWAKKLQALKELELDKSDYQFLKEFVKKNKLMFIPLKAQILEELGEFKED